MNSLRLPRHLRDDTVLFWAVRNAGAYWRGFAISTLLLAPLALFAPEAFIFATLVGFVLARLNARLFRFELTRTHLRLKAAALVPSLRIPWHGIADARVDAARQDGPGAPEVGTLVLRLADGPELPVTELVAPYEALEAIRELKTRAAATAREAPAWRREAA